MVGNGLSNRSRLAYGGLQVHQQTRACIDLDNGAPLRSQRPGNVLCNQIDAGDVQAHHACSQHGLRGQFGVHFIRDIQRHITGAHDEHGPAFFWHAVGRQALALEFQYRGGVFFQPDGVEWEIFFFATAGVRVDLKLDQLRNSVNTIAHHIGSLAFVGGSHMVTHHQQPVLFTQDESLHHDFAALCQGNAVSGFDVFLFGKLE